MNVRYTLLSRAWLRWCMDHPGRGRPYSIRDLAETVGLSHHSMIGHLLNGRRAECDADLAHRIAEAVGVAVLTLFAPPPSPNEIDPASTENRVA